MIADILPDRPAIEQQANSKLTRGLTHRQSGRIFVHTPTLRLAEKVGRDAEAKSANESFNPPRAVATSEFS